VSRLQQLEPLGVFVTAIYEAEIEAEETNAPHPAEIPCIKVLYAGSQFEPQQSVGVVSQQETLTVLVVVEASKMYQLVLGAMYLVGTVKKMLVGYQVEGCNRLTVKSVTFEPDPDGFAGYWTYHMTFECTALVVQYLEEDTSPLITQITGNMDTIDTDGELEQVDTANAPAI